MKTGAAVYCASERSAFAIVPGPPKKTSEPADEHGHGAPTRMNWARLLKRVFDLDLEHCPQCGGNFKIIAAIEAPAVIVKILTHLGLLPKSRSTPHRHDLAQRACCAAR